LTPLVGRTEELALLGARWEQATAGEGQAVLLSGEPGIGKSRLIQELKERVIQEGATRIEFRCSPYYQNSALYPVIERLHRVLQFARDDAPAVKLEKLEQTLSRYDFPQADTLALFAALLSLPPPESVPPLTLSPQKQKGKTLEALARWLFEEADENVVYTAWEDLHWADPSTLEFLTLCLDYVPTARMLALLVFRPELTPPWGTRSYLSQVTLGRLGRAQVEGIVERVTKGRAFPSAVVEQVVAKTDGVPLFVEELTKIIVKSGMLRAVNSHYELAGPLSALSIPSTLQDSMMARLDRLGTAKEVAQLGAVVGREFSHELLRAVSPRAEEALQQGLQQLVDAELICRRGLPSQGSYLFNHALVQDTAYQSLLKSTRKHHHEQIAQVLEDRFPEAQETQPELLAHHYTEAGLLAQAIPYWQQAGQRAVQRLANAEAVAHFTQGLALLQTLQDTPARVQQELQLQLALGPPLIAIKGYAAPEGKATYSRALELCRQQGETPQLFPTLLGLRAAYVAQGDNICRP
jgi:predicted ATPase